MLIGEQTVTERSQQERAELLAERGRGPRVSEQRSHEAAPGDTEGRAEQGRRGPRRTS